jgi:hypothetical protein
MGRSCHLCVDAISHVFMYRMSDVRRTVRNSLDEARRATERRMLEDAYATMRLLGVYSGGEAQTAP